MSTEGQEYSIANQASAISNYCTQHQFEIVATYRDPGRSGLLLKNRPGLMRLLNDVIHHPPYNAVLVYDVSRWGRFQDVDEAAYYEFICRSAGIPVHYCAEAFSDEITLTNSIMKGLKRMMAAEYSRELGEKVLHGLRRYVRMGYKVGATAPYGYRRMLVDEVGEAKQLLKPGERKAIHTHHVKLVVGPKREVETVRKIFWWKAKEHWPIARITRELNRKGIVFPNSEQGPQGRWTAYNVAHVLKDPKYMGLNVWGRTTQRLKTYHKPLEPSQWITKEGAFPAIVSRELFEEAATAIRDSHWTDESLLDELRAILRCKGAVSEAILNAEPGSILESLRNHFGSFTAACEKIGYRQTYNYELARARGVKRQQMQHELVSALAHKYRAQLTVHRSRWSPRPHLRLGSTDVAVHLCPSFIRRSRPYWLLTPRISEKHYVSLCCMLASDNEHIDSMWLVATLGNIKYRVQLHAGHEWFSTALQIKSLSRFCANVRKVLREPGDLHSV
jgi:DNA invertase Pin-like site-specific DNA recombinase